MTELHTEAHARALDAADPLARFRDAFHMPVHAGGEATYFCGNSLGLQPRATRAAVNAELDYWGELAVEGHFKGRLPWMDYHHAVRDALATLVGAHPDEVIAMNTLTVNLHLMMVSFYRPTAARPAILMEAGAFPSDRHAVESQIRFHGFDPRTDLIEVEPDLPGGLFSDEAIAAAIAEHGPRLALVLWPGIQYRTGQAFDLAEVARLGRAQGAAVGFDLAHAVGNLPLALHDSGADFAVWCHYKYLNSGPGALGGAFVHERHARAVLPRFAGWWGHEKATRFEMRPDFVPTPGADGWQLSNPPILALAPLRASLDLFAEAGLPALREKSLKLTGYLEALIDARIGDVLEIVTPRDTARRGAQLSLRVREGRAAGRALFDHLVERGFIGDWREPDVIRISPAPLYNRFLDVQRLVAAIETWRDAR
ncbi:kynureninase [Coralloluteibacterium thermophilus]|uniref:Kynureninase n=1 Tax=Coralloluteibacterium thermophilum TaxID=2707049 RepID=A0ABV9NGX3_9GAMM